MGRFHFIKKIVNFSIRYPEPPAYVPIQMKCVLKYTPVLRQKLPYTFVRLKLCLPQLNNMHIKLCIEYYAKYIVLRKLK